MILAGIDIGGTKCAVCLGQVTGDSIELLAKEKFATPDTPLEALSQLVANLDSLLSKTDCESPKAIGISCGGPLDSDLGLILSPPNLPGWDKIDVVTPFRDKFTVPVGLQNDANACALAEWKWGAGKGTKNMIFLTFGTGMGAGFILNGDLYAGTNGNAGEVGHIRLEDDGPIGYGKAGSFEGFCSGGGIAQLARTMVQERLASGKSCDFCDGENLDNLSAKVVGEAAQAGQIFAQEIYARVGRQLGKGLAILVDVLNPQKIVIGSIYGRQQPLLEPYTMEVLYREALEQSLAVCEIVPAGLGEQVGDFASLSVAAHILDKHM